MEPQVKKNHYFRKKYDDLKRFISYFYQIELTTDLDSKKILEIGKGTGLVSAYLKELGYQVTTADIAADLQPDVVADIRQLPFPDNAFDTVTACEVLEHLPFEDFPKAIAELRRVSSKYVLISLPYHSTGFELVFRFPGVRTLFKRMFIDLFFRIPLKFGGIKTSGQHYWEIDCCQWSLKKVRSEIKKYFKIRREVRPVLNYYHRFFILEKQ